MYLFLFISCNQEEKETISPNIIWLVAEDQSPEFFPMYGDLTTKLPYLSNLAKDGVVYNNAYSPVPVCAPARSAIISGSYPTSLGTHNMRTYNAYNRENQPAMGIPSYSPIFQSGIKMFPRYLREKGCGVGVLDCPTLRIDADKVYEIIKTKDPAIIGFSTTTYSLTRAIDIAKKIRDKLPEKLTVVGGSHTNVAGIETANEYGKYFDAE